MNPNQNRWLQLAHVAVCAALADVACTDEALMEALFVGMPAVKIDEVTAAAVAEALRRAGPSKTRRLHWTVSTAVALANSSMFPSRT